MEKATMEAAAGLPPLEVKRRTAAQLLDMETGTLAKIPPGELPRRWDGKGWRYRYADLIAYVNRQYDGSAPRIVQAPRRPPARAAS